MDPSCRRHGHPHLKRGVPRRQVREELEELYHRAGYMGPVNLHWTPGLRKTHDRNWRRYAQVMPYAETPRFELAPQTTHLPARNRRGLLAHEVGHVLDPHGSEDDADQAAYEALGVKIGYDHRWPGKGLQVARNPRRKGYLLDELLASDSDFARPALERAQRVIADEPMRWYFEESDKEYWDEREEFRNVAPPYPVMWIEHKAPRFIRSEEQGVVDWPSAKNWRRAGTLMVSFTKDELMEIDPEVASRFPTSKWITRATVFGSEEEGISDPGPRFSFFYGVDPDGTMSRGVGTDFMVQPEGPIKDALHRASPEVRQKAALEAGNYYKGPWRVALLAIYFMHAKGTSLRETKVPHKVAERRRKKGRPTGRGYKVLDIGLGARQTLKEVRSEGGDSKRALRKHLRRGGFAVYKPERPHVSGFVGSMWRGHAWVRRDKEDQVEKDYRVRTDKRRRKQKRRKRKNPSEHERVREAFRRWQATGDSEAYREWKHARMRIGLPPEPTTWPTAREVLAAWPNTKRKRIRVLEAENVIKTRLRAAGWHQDPHGSVSRDVWISPRGTRRVTFRRSSILWERGGRGNWVKDYSMHRWGDTMSTIDYAELTKKVYEEVLADPYARNPDEEPMLPARIPTQVGAAPRRHDLALMAQGQAPFVYLPADHSPRSLPRVGRALEAMLVSPPLEGGLATPDAWEDLLAAVGTSAKLYVVDRNGERWQVLRVNFDPGGYTGELELRHQGRMARRGTVWVDLEHAYGSMLPVVVYKGV